MENNEERILIIKITSDPYTCDIGGICKDKVCLKTLCEMGITRQEAIDKMSMAWCNKEFKNNASAEDIDYCDRIAETMLNALLGVEK